MQNIAFIEHRDVVRVDPDRLWFLAGELGPDTAQDMVARATEELTVRLMQLRAANAGDNMEAIAKLARGIAAIAEQVGMVTLARVSRDVSLCAGVAERTAFAATFARLQRISEICLLDAWYDEDQRV